MSVRKESTSTFLILACNLKFYFLNFTQVCFWPDTCTFNWVNVFCTFTWVILDYLLHFCSSLNHYLNSTDHQMVPAWCTGLCTTSLINTWTWDCSKLRDRVWRWTSCSFSLKNCLKSLQNSTKPNLLFHK